MPDNLDLVSMDEMVEEIKKRFDTLVILTRRQVDKDNDDIHYNFKDKLGCLGLMKIAEKQIVDGYAKKETGTFNE